MPKRIFAFMILVLLVCVNVVSAQDGGSSLQAWADTPASAINLTQQMGWPRFSRQVNAISTYTADGDPTLSCAPGHTHSVWATFVAPQTGYIAIEGVGSNYSSVIAVFKKTPTAANQIQCNNQFTAPPDVEWVTFRVSAGTRYYVIFAADNLDPKVDGSSVLSFTFKLNAYRSYGFTIPGAGTYSNTQPEIENALSAAEAIGSCGSANYLVYYRFTPSVSGRYEFSTVDSSYDTTLILTDSAGTILSCNRDININTANSRLRPTLTARHLYFIGIGQDTAGVNPQTNDMVLSFRVRKL